MRSTMLHKADQRVNVNHGWVNSFFTFANRQDPENNRFGTLIALNQDTIAPGQGFGMHAHDNVEIITIPLRGNLEHQDSLGNSGVIRQGDVQVMSAGTRIAHSEYNHDQNVPVELLQIWIRPNQRGVAPRYGQLTVPAADRLNRLVQVVSPEVSEQPTWIHQQAWFHLGRFEAGRTTTYAVKRPGDGVYTFVISGEVTVNGQALRTGDGFGLAGEARLDYAFTADAEVLVMEFPMH